jgi:HSP20 family protein
MNPHWMPVLFAPPPAPVMPTPISTLQATEEGFRLEVPLPGFKAEDIQVRVEGALLAITARTRSTTSTEGGETQSQRSFAQTLTLPAQVEAAELKQRFENDVLILTLPVRKSSAGSV